MRPEIHPPYSATTITCACGRVLETRSTRQDLRVEICSACHPFFTGQQHIADLEGRVERFHKRYKRAKKT